MKKKVMSKEALEGMYAGTKLEEKAPEEEVVTESEAETNVEPKSEDNAKPDENESILADVQASLVEKTEAFDALTAELSKANESLAAVTETSDALVAVVASQVARFRTAIDLAEVDMTDMDANSILKEFKSIEKKFMDTLPSGEVTPAAPVAEEELKPVATINDKAAYASLGFNE